MKIRPLTILVSPLDWGLGHASRMIPLIGRFAGDGHRVILAGSGRSAELLRETFPGLEFVSLPGHSVHLGSGKFSGMHLVFQVPAMVFSVIREHRLVKKIVRDKAVDILVSDNRYGLHCRNTWSVFITHQVSPVLPAILQWLEFPLYLIIRKLILNFDTCWIPDFPDQEVNVSGKLSHRFKTPSNARFIGILSRFISPFDRGEQQQSVNYDVAIVLSGPEPQVSEFEKKLVSLLIPLKKKVILLRGMRHTPIDADGYSESDIHPVTHLGTEAFSRVLTQAGLVISRSGYSGIMDFIALGISAVLVPTPGQSEQEYLAGRLSEKGWFTCVKEDELDLAAMEKTGDQHSQNEKPFHSAWPDFQFIEDLYREYDHNGD